MVTTGVFETVHGAKYIAQLCKHFAHKVPAEFEDNKGNVAFAFGPATLSADETALTVRIDLVEGAEPAMAQSVIDSHLERFAFREKFTKMAWQ